MNSFLADLGRLIFGDGVVTGNLQPLIFATGCAFWGALAVALDFILFHVRGKSILKLTYSTSGAAFRLFCLWGLGAAIGGFLGVSASVVSLSKAGCIGVGLAWPVILPRLIDSINDDDVQAFTPGEN